MFEARSAPQRNEYKVTDSFDFVLGFCFASKIWYVSKTQGSQAKDCNSPENSCKSLADVFSLVDWGDTIYLDGTNTKENPYECLTMTSPQLRTTLNISISFIGQNAPAYLSCPNGIFFTGGQVQVHFSGLVFYSTPMSFYLCSVYIQKSVFKNPLLGMALLKFYSVGNLTIFQSVFQENAIISVDDGHFVLLSESRLQNNTEMAATIIPSQKGKVKVDHCEFINSQGGLKITSVRNSSVFLSNTIFSKHTVKPSFVLELESTSEAVIQNVTIEKSLIVSDNSRKSAAVYIALSEEGNNTVNITDSAFKENTFNAGGVGAMIIDNGPDVMKSKGCRNFLFNDSTEAYSVFSYTNRVLVTNCAFNRNFGKYAGALLIFNGLTRLTNCTFRDNFAEFRAGHISIGEGSGGAEIYNCTLRQKERKTTFLSYESNNTVSFLYSGTLGTLVMKDTVMDFTPFLHEQVLVEIVNGGHVAIENTSSILCPVGNRISVDNYSHGLVTRSTGSAASCALEVKMYGIYCERCPDGFYSLQRGVAYGTRVNDDIKCLPCPFGADCSRNVENENNFWGSLVKQNPPTLHFYMCPPGYCEPPKDSSLLTYNGCHGHRSGVLCGACAVGYSETLFSSECALNEDCGDIWFWPVAILYILLMAIYFVKKPPIVPFLTSQILWFRKTKMEQISNEKTSDSRENKVSDAASTDKGYQKVVFYFYQASSLLFGGTTRESNIVPFLLASFNFQVPTSPSGLGCPFPGLTVVTKELFIMSGFFILLLSVFLIHGFQRLVSRLRRRCCPSLASHLSAVAEVVLLGYASLTTSMLKLLTVQRIEPGDELRLFYDGNIVLFTWWQCILLAFVTAFVIPYVGLLYWGANKLNVKCITAREFLFASFFPLPFLLYWAIFRRKQICDNTESQEQNKERAAVMRVLYGPFRPPTDGQRGSLHWESVLISRRLILILLFTFIGDASIRLMLSTVVCLFVALHHILWNPYKDSKANKLETVSLITLVIFGLFNTVRATFITAGVRHRGPIKTYIDALNWIQVSILLVIPVVLIIAVIFAIVSQIGRLVCVSAILFCQMFQSRKEIRRSSVVSKRNSLERNNRESLFSDAEVIEQPNKRFVHEMIEGSPLSSSEEICHKEPVMN